jgi:hemolysin III
MMLLNLREPVSAWSHGAGLMMALGLTWVFWRQCGRQLDVEDGEPTLYERGKTVTMLIFGLSLAVCYGNSFLYHGVKLNGEPLMRLRRLDHVGIYVLIAGTYTPAAWSLMKATWRRGTLKVVWCVAGFCGARVWLGGILPSWISTMIYLAMGWGVLFCYRELARNLSHRTLLPLPLGGIFYSVGALINLSGWPVLRSGVFGAHELFHFFVIAGSACHVLFMIRVVVPARAPAGWLDVDVAPSPLSRADRGPLASSLGRFGVRRSLHLSEAILRRPYFPYLARQGHLEAWEAATPEQTSVIPTAEP